MSERKFHQEVDKAMKYAMDCNGPHGEWDGRFEQMSNRHHG